MGNCLWRKKQTDFRIFVVTGDKPYSGMDANLRMVLHDETGKKSHEFKLHHWFRNDFERGASDEFRIDLPSDTKFGDVAHIEFWRDNYGIGASWYVERVAVEDMRTNQRFVFPVYRWIKAHYHYVIKHLDTQLPQLDEHANQRRMELDEKKKHYELASKAPGMPAQIKLMPEDEKFSWDYKWNIVKTKAYLLAASKIIKLTSGDWESLASLKNVYTKEHLVEPVGAKRWTNDGYFGLQRVSSCSHGLIKLCTEIPDKFGVTDEMLQPLLEGMTISEAIQKKKLFMVDLDILKDLPCAKPEWKVCAPIALFLENSEKQLVPLAIQLFQDKGPNNPVFLPTDNPWTWLLAKMWYNNADASYHQSLTHLGLTHLIMEGISVITHRNLSQSHPIFKLLAPHFLYLIAINTRGLEVLISEGGWVDKTMTVGIKGMFELIKRGCERWRMDVDGLIPENLKERGLMEPGVLHYFPYRDDSLLMFEAIKNYVTDMVNLYYPTPDLLTGDCEIQAWVAEMVKPKDQGGVGLNGVPGNGKFTSTDQLIDVLTCIISTCSVGHAAANFPQYDEYAFPPNFPGLLRGQAPTDKNPRTEQDILESIPDKMTTLDTMVVTKILSGKGTKSLGDFEVNYIFDPEARQIVETFRKNILEAGKVIKQRNEERNPPYVWLEPENIPNSISI